MPDILNQYGKDSSQPQQPRATEGGECEADGNIPNYKPPKGPTSQMQQGPGIHGTNHGNCGTQGKR